MPPKFLVDEYLSDSSDLKDNLAPDAVVRHYQEYGRTELRGYQHIDATYNIESVVTSLDGFVLLSGWINRRLHADLELTMRIGYEVFTVPKDQLAFYRREDVSQHLDEPGLRAAFIGLFSVGAPIRATQISFSLGGHQSQQNHTIHPLSQAAFLHAVLTRAAYVANLPLSNSLSACSFLSRALAPIWKSHLRGITFAEVYTSKKSVNVQANQPSAVTVLYNDLTLLRAQLMLMARALDGQPMEWIIVLNKCDDLDAFLREVAALDDLVPFALRVIVASANSGFSAANNHGASVAKGTRVLIINPDVFPNPACKVSPVALINMPLQKGVLLGTQLVYGTGALMHDGMHIVESPTYDEETKTPRAMLRVEHFGKGSIDGSSAQPKMRRVPAVTGALWLMQQESFFKLGGLSTDYLFAHYEDADYCLRVWDQGGQVQVFEPAVLTHLEGVGSHNSPIGTSTRWLNRLTFSERWSGKYRSLGTVETGHSS